MCTYQVYQLYTHQVLCMSTYQVYQLYAQQVLCRVPTRCTSCMPSRCYVVYLPGVPAVCPTGLMSVYLPGVPAWYSPGFSCLWPAVGLVCWPSCSGCSGVGVLAQLFRLQWGWCAGPAVQAAVGLVCWPSCSGCSGVGVLAQLFRLQWGWCAGPAVQAAVGLVCWPSCSGCSGVGVLAQLFRLQWGWCAGPAVQAAAWMEVWWDQTNSSLESGRLRHYLQQSSHQLCGFGGVLSCDQVVDWNISFLERSRGHPCCNGTGVCMCLSLISDF